jgi:hypothetical protein
MWCGSFSLFFFVSPDKIISRRCRGIIAGRMVVLREEKDGSEGVAQEGT